MSPDSHQPPPQPRPHAHTHAHHPHHHGGEGEAADLDWETLGEHLEREAELSMPFLEETAAWLRDLTGRHEVTRVLDLGSGPGVTTTALAHAFPGAEVVAVDSAEGLLERARARAARERLGSRFTARLAQLPHDVPSLGSAGLVWTSNVVHHLGDQRAALEAFAAPLEPGGVLAVRERGLPTRFLPRDIGIGRPGLQARMDVAEEGWFESMRAALPDYTRTVEDWPGMLAAAGLAPTGSRTFLTDLPAPLDPGARAHLRARVERARDSLADDLSPEDLETLEVLLDDGSAEGLMRRADVFLLSATTVHTAVRT